MHEDGLLPIFSLDRNHCIEYCNNAFRELLASHDSPVGRSIAELFGTDALAVFMVSGDSQPHKKVFWHVKTPKGALRFECHLYCTGDNRLVVAEKPVITEVDIFAKLGSLNMDLMQMARDLEKRNATAEAENQHLQSEIAKTLAQAERLSALAAMAAGVAHEIAQPLNSIKLAADSAVFWRGVGQSVSFDETISDMEVISRQADRIDKIIRHMRSLVQRHRLDVTACNLNVVVQDALCEIQPNISNADITLNSSFDKTLPPVWGNAVGIAEVVTNLIANAINALSKPDYPDKAITIRTLRSEDCAVLEIRDNGPGIDEAIRGKIFDPFFTTDPGGSGMGLGLSIVQAIVTAHNGHIDVFPNYPQGALFRIEFPLSDIKAASSE